MTPETRIFDRLSALADTTRCRLLLLLDRHDLTVTELCTVLQLPQSTVSRHLKLLADDGWVSSLKEGTSRRYRATLDRLEPTARRLWLLARGPVAELAAAEQDSRRLEAVLAERRVRSREFFTTAAGDWDRLRHELFGERADLLPLLALLDEGWVVGDLGCGTGQMTAHLAPFVSRVVAVDDSAAMLQAARGRLRSFSNVDLRQGQLESLPVESEELDAALLFLVLHHLPDPARAVAEVARVLKPGGRLLVVDMTSHDREDLRQEMGHVWLGFGEEQLTKWLLAAGFDEPRFLPVPVDPKARGPALFAAGARRRREEAILGASSVADYSTLPTRSIHPSS